MKKYITVFTQTISNYSAYRFQILLSIFYSFITPAVMIIALAGARATSGFVVNLIPYYVLISIIQPLTKSEIQDQIQELAFSGDVNNFLIKPTSLYLWLFSKEAAQRVITLVLVLPLILIALFIFNRGGLEIDGIKILLTVGSLLISFWLSYNFSYLVGLISFWFEEFWALSNLKQVLVALLGGVILPYSFFPQFLQNLNKLTPFPYLVSWPVRILQGEFIPLDFLYAFTWAFLFLILSQILWRGAIKKYSNVGG